MSQVDQDPMRTTNSELLVDNSNTLVCNLKHLPVIITLKIEFTPTLKIVEFESKSQVKALKVFGKWSWCLKVLMFLSFWFSQMVNSLKLKNELDPWKSLKRSAWACNIHCLNFKLQIKPPQNTKTNTIK